jgi:predicted O-linked N-acetylglucosamine transferase (SPINDLY family)
MTTTVAEVLQLAVAGHQAGQWDEVRLLCGEILKVAPDHAETLYLLGSVAQERGDLEEAAGYFRRVRVLDPQCPEVLNSLATVLTDLGQWDEALPLYEDACRRAPESDLFRMNFGIALHLAGRLSEAEGCYLQALKQNPQSPDILTNLGNVYRDLGQFEAARNAYESALQSDPAMIATLRNLSLLLNDARQWQAAFSCVSRWVALEPENLQAHVLLGRLYEKTEAYPEAMEVYERVLFQEPGHREVRLRLAVLYQACNQPEAVCRHAGVLYEETPQCLDVLGLLGAACFQSRDYQNAKRYYEEALALSPDLPKAHANLGTLYFLAQQPDRAIHHYQKALELDPAYADVYQRLGVAYQQTNQPQQAIACYEAAYRNTGRDGFRILSALTLPCVYASQSEVTTYRQRLLKHLESLEASPPQLKDPVKEVGITPFYLAYQGENDREIQSRIAALFQPTFAKRPKIVSRPPLEGRKIRIGFVSRFLYQEHTIGKLYEGLLARLDRRVFEVCVLVFRDPSLQGTPLTIQPEDTLSFLPLDDTEASVRQVEACELDVLFYPDIGMEPNTYFLAMHRLAPMQCVGFGHPVTTGIPTVDYYLSSELLEGEDPQAHYRETLYQTHRFVCYENPPTTPSPKTRKDFGLSESVHLYLCAQSLFKVHPDFDEILAGILREDPDAEIVFLHAPFSALGDSLRQRWETVMPDVAHRIRILERLGQEDFIRLQSLSDVVLDTLHFGSGNTCLEALACGVPIITMPSPYMRGRVVDACYRLMEITECTASTPQEYVALAVRLGTQPALREHVSETLRSRSERLFGRTDYVEEVATFLREALAERLGSAKEGWE